MSKLKTFSCILTGIMLLSMLASLPAQPAAAATNAIGNVTISNVRDVSFVVSWITNTPTDGSVSYGTTMALGNTATDTIGSTTSHYVTVSGLTQLTTYYFQVTSGAETDPTIYQVTTGPQIITSPIFSVYGYVYSDVAKLIAAPNVIIYMYLINNDGAGSPGTSQLVSARTNASGLWSYQMINARTSDLSSTFTITAGGDNMQVSAQGGIVGTYGLTTPWVFAIPTGATNLRRVGDIVLSDVPTAVMLSSFTGESQYQAVTLNWQTVNEISLQTFNVLRSTTLAGEKQLVTTLAAKGEPMGALYHFKESVAPGQTYYYWLELVKESGSELSGPMMVTVRYPTFIPLSMNR